MTVEDRKYSSTAVQALVASGIDDSQLALTGDDISSYDEVGPYIIAVGIDISHFELMLIDARSGNTFTIDESGRGFDGTQPQSHDPGELIWHVSCADDFREIRDHMRTTSRDDHTQYMKANGTRHDLTARHTLGTVVPVGDDGDIQSAGGSDTPDAGDPALGAAPANHFHPIAAGAITKPKLAADQQLPSGMIAPFAGAVPTGWLECDGSEILDATYPTLAAYLGTTWGVGSGGHTVLPDFRGRGLIGAGSGTGLTPRTLGVSLGREAFTMNASLLPGHTHPIGGSTSSDAHTHTGGTANAGPTTHFMDGDPGTVFLIKLGGPQNDYTVNPSAANRSQGVTFSDVDPHAQHSHSFTTDSSSHSHTLPAATGSAGVTDQTVNIMNPVAVVRYCIKT